MVNCSEICTKVVNCSACLLKSNLGIRYIIQVTLLILKTQVTLTASNIIMIERFQFWVKNTLVIICCDWHKIYMPPAWFTLKWFIWKFIMMWIQWNLDNWPTSYHNRKSVIYSWPTLIQPKTVIHWFGHTYNLLNSAGESQFCGLWFSFDQF